MAFRLVLVTNGHRLGLWMAEGLAARGIRVDATAYVTKPIWPAPPPRGPVAWAKALLKAPLNWKNRVDPRRPSPAEFARHSQKVVVTGSLNSARMVRDLNRLEGDFLLLGGLGIVKAPVLRTARLGVLNSHPGLLPWCRGNGVVAHSLARGVALGATCHYVNEGIDTGEIIERRLLEVGQSSIPLADLENQAIRLAAELLVAVVAQTVEANHAPPRLAQTERFAYCRLPGAEMRAAVEEQARQGRARELFERWRDAGCPPPEYRLSESFVLPAGAEVPAAPTPRGKS